jgi:CheY-like chemotaxis protein
MTLELENFVLEKADAEFSPGCKPGRYVIIKVSDTGTGISPEVRKKIFEPFFTTKEAGKGTGLGLSTVLAIAKSHGGQVDCYSELGKGTVFKVLLPAHEGARKPEPETTPAEDVETSGQGKLVLVVDDDEVIRNMAKKTLERGGYGVLLAVNGAVAVSLYSHHRGQIAVVITDMAMPVMDGQATMQALKAMDPSVKIIGSSGLETASGLGLSGKGGFDRFVGKPYVARTLLQAVAEVIGNREP